MSSFCGQQNESESKNSDGDLLDCDGSDAQHLHVSHISSTSHKHRCSQIWIPLHVSQGDAHASLVLASFINNILMFTNFYHSCKI